MNAADEPSEPHDHSSADAGDHSGCSEAGTRDEPNDAEARLDAALDFLDAARNGELEPGAAIVAIEASRDELSEGHPELRGKALSGLGEALALADRLEDAKAAHAEAIALLRAHEDPEALAEALEASAGTHHDAGELEEALWQREESQRLYAMLGDAVSESRILRSLALDRIAAGQPDGAIAALHESLELDEALGEEEAVAEGLVTLGLLLDSLGRIEVARRCLGKALRIRRELKDRGGEIEIMVALGRLAVAAGETEDARGHMNKALELCRQSQRSDEERDLLIELAGIERDAGDPEVAAMLLDLAIDQALAAGDRGGELETRLARVDLALASEDWSSARAAREAFPTPAEDLPSELQQSIAELDARLRLIAALNPGAAVLAETDRSQARVMLEGLADSAPARGGLALLDYVETPSEETRGRVAEAILALDEQGQDAARDQLSALLDVLDD